MCTESGIAKPDSGLTFDSFKIGDKVTVERGYKEDTWTGVRTVVRIDASYVYLNSPEGRDGGFFPSSLKLVPVPAPVSALEDARLADAAWKSFLVKVPK